MVSPHHSRAGDLPKAFAARDFDTVRQMLADDVHLGDARLECR